MKPRTLKVSGLNSFLEEQTIDFARLTEKGLFGIFGPTGSGKSTILDAITLALYGQISRKSGMYINTESDKLYLYFEFDVGMGSDRKTYVVERSLKKNSNGGINTVFVKLLSYDKNGNEEVVAENFQPVNKEIQSNVIGLSFEDFTRTVVLPQGKFSEFLTLTGGDRNRMLERILGLEDYGDKLSKRIKNKRDAYKDQHNQLTGELNRYEGVSKENIDILREQLNRINAKEEELKKELDILNKKHEKYKKVKDLQKELVEYRKREIELKERTEEILDKSFKLERGKSALNVMPYIENLTKIHEDIAKSNIELTKHKIEMNKLMSQRIKTENEYKEAYRRKEEELPKLIEESAKAHQAIKYMNDRNSQQKERDALANKYKEKSSEIKEIEEQLKSIRENIDKCNSEIEVNEDKIKQKTVAPEYRSRLQDAYGDLKKYNELTVSHNKEEDKRRILSEEIVKIEEKLNKFLDNIEGKEREIEDTNKVLQKLNENTPKDNNVILKQKMEVENLKKNKKEYIEESAKKDKCNKEIDELSIRISKRTEELKGKTEELANKERDMEALEKEIRELERRNLASHLASELISGEPCPLCGSTEHPHISQVIDDEALEKKREIFNVLKEDINTRKSCLDDVKTKLMLDNNLLERSKEDLKNIINRIPDLDIAELDKEIEALESDVKKAEEYRSKWDKDSKELNDRLMKLKDEKGKLEKDQATFSEGLRKDKESLKESTNKIAEISEELEKVYESLKASKEELGVQNIEAKLKEIYEDDNLIVELNKKLKELKEKIKVIESNKGKLEEGLSKSQRELDNIGDQGKDKKKRIDELDKEIKEIVGDKDPNQYKEEIETTKEQVVAKEKSLKEKLDSENKQISNLEIQISGTEKAIGSLKESEELGENKLGEVLKENKFKDKDEVLVSAITKESIVLLEKEIRVYEDELKKIEQDIKRVEKLLGDDSITEEEWNKLNIEITTKQEERNRIIDERGQKRNQLSEMEKNLKEVKRLRKEIKAIDGKVDILNDIFGLTSGRRFVEFVSRSHLKYISRMATEKLKEITRERYGLELDSESNFVIIDNYNGGARRECNSLSGGETFLTSLSLALALSTKIQLKGNTSIEFFFLDEGFGTLDSSLLEVVMNSLERLHKDDLSVGIISHVDELKNRVPVKLVVTPSEPGVHGTKVQVEYS